MASTPGRPDDAAKAQAKADREARDALRRAETERQNRRKYTEKTIRDAALAAQEKGRKDEEARLRRVAEAEAKKAARKNKGRNN